MKIGIHRLEKETSDVAKGVTMVLRTSGKKPISAIILAGALTRFLLIPFRSLSEVYAGRFRNRKSDCDLRSAHRDRRWSECHL